MSRKVSKLIKDPDMAGVGPALLRASQRAREIAAQTGTPLVVLENGRVVKRMIKPEDSKGPSVVSRRSSVKRHKS